MGTEAEVEVDGDQLRLARLGRCRVAVPCRRPKVDTILLREAGAPRWAAFRVLPRWKSQTPILARPGPKPRGQAYVVLDHPCIASSD